MILLSMIKREKWVMAALELRHLFFLEKKALNKSIHSYIKHKNTPRSI
jgi:hypothetical protein